MCPGRQCEIGDGFAARDQEIGYAKGSGGMDRLADLETEDQLQEIRSGRVLRNMGMLAHPGLTSARPVARLATTISVPPR